MPSARKLIRPLRTATAALVTGALAASALVVVGAASPASAAPLPNLQCDQNTLYAVSTATSGLYAVNLANNAEITKVTDYAGNNGFGVTPGGTDAWAINTSSGAGNAIVHLNMANGTPETITRTKDATGSIIRGALNPANGIFYFSSNNSPATLVAYDTTKPAATAELGIVGRITGPNGGSIATTGDFAFNSSGVLFIVAGGSIYRTTTAIPTDASNPTGTIGTALVTTLSGVTSTPGIAFSSDGYLYLTSGSNLYKINPATGAQVGPTVALKIGSTAYSPNDLASCNYANTTQATATVSTPAKAGDQFTLTLSTPGNTNQGTATSPATTSTSGTSVTAGPVLAVKGDDYTSTLTAGNGTTNLDDYNVTWTATKADGTVVQTGTGPTATYTYPAGAANGDGTDVSVKYTVAPKAAAGDDTGSTPSGTKLDVAAANGVLKNDAPGVTIVSNTQPAHATSTVTVAADGSYSYTPASDFSGTDVFYYTVKDATGATATAKVTITVTPVATADNLVTPAQKGQPATVSPLANDKGSFGANAVKLVGTGGAEVTTLEVTGGTWTVSNNQITFTPTSPDYSGDPAPVSYTVTDTNGQKSPAATVTVGYEVASAGDTVTGKTPGQAVSVDVLANDSTNLTAASVKLVGADADGKIVVANQGTWSVSAGKVVFTPIADYTGNPTPVKYTAANAAGTTTQPATVTVGYSASAKNDLVDGKALTTAVTVDVVANDSQNVDKTKVTIDTALGDGRTLDVTGGQWTVNPDSGAITFTPADGYTGDPAPITYSVLDTLGNKVSATVTVRYVVAAKADSTTGVAQNTNAVVDVLANDSQNVDKTKVTIVDPANSGAPVTTLIVANQGTWTVSATTGEITFAPNSGYTGNPTPITYAVTDGHGATATAKVTVTYEVKAAADEKLNNEPKTTVTVDVLANDSKNLLASSVKIVGAPGAGTSLTVDGQGVWTVDATTGEISFKPETGFTGNPAAIKYTADDGTGQSIPATSVTIGYVPNAVNDLVEGATPKQPVEVAVLSNDSANLNPASVKIVDPANPGTPVTTLAVADGEWTVGTSNGHITYTPKPGNTANPAAITYQASDDHGNTKQATVTVRFSVTAADDSKPAQAQGSTVEVDVLANDSANIVPSSVKIVDPADASGATTVTTLTVDGQGVWTVAPGTGAISFKPEDGYTGNPTPITYVAGDGFGAADTAEVAITYVVKAVADKAEDQAVTKPVTVDVLANDSKNLLPGSVKIVDPAAPGVPVTTLDVTGGQWTVDPATGKITFTPVDGYTGDPAPISYVADDGTGQSIPATAVTVTYQPDAENDVADGKAPGLPVKVDVLGNDTQNLLPGSVRILPDPSNTTNAVDTLTVTGGKWTIDPASGEITFTPDADYTGNPAPITYQAKTASGEAVTATVAVRFTVAAKADEKRGQAQGATVTVDVLANDSKNLEADTVVIDGATGDGRTLEVTGEGTWTVDETTGAISFKPEDGYSGNPTAIKYTAGDGFGVTASAGVVVTYVVKAAADSSPANELRKPVTVDVLANDSKNLKPATVKIVDPAHPGSPVTTLVVDDQGTWTVSLSDGKITFAPVDGYVGNPTPISYVAGDGTGQSIPATTVTVTFQAQAANDTKADQEVGKPVTVDVVANDAGSFGSTPDVKLIGAEGALVTSLQVPNQGTWTVNSAGQVVFTPVDGFEGDPSSVTYRVTDTSGLTSDATVTVTYKPVAVADTADAPGLGLKTKVDVLANDRGVIDPASVTIVGAPGDGKTLVVDGQGTWTVDEDGVITFEPAEGFASDPTSITYEAIGNHGTVISGSVGVNYAPVAVDDVKNGGKLGTPFTVDVLANDKGAFVAASVVIVGAPGDGKTLVVDGQGTWTVDAVTGAVTFTPAAGYTGNPTPVKYTVTDVDGDTATASVTVTYKPVAAADVSKNNKPGQPVTVNVLGNDGGAFDPTSVRIVDPKTGQRVTSYGVLGEGIWSVDPTTGAITFTPAVGFTGTPAPITYEVTDLEGNTTSATLSIQYAPVPPPVAQALASTGVEGVVGGLVALLLLLSGACALLVARRRTATA
ncbi:Ig-like domain-containing protein [Schumannella soli]|uniref:Tandem-95 repeat protein n=1 Tax=Schumannella soli TaxID=2590779 RepID=A0A506Y7Z8_9MICO|nr:tandem-95 repeat protein [Schumannella soli]TPW78003.1 tandem-95 repeat protein [Schumannella soli]